MPSFTLNSSSQSGNAILGFGWSLGGLPAVARCPQTVAQDGSHGGVNYNGSDRFCLDGQRLPVINGGTYGADGSEYRIEIESFSRVIVHNATGVSGPGRFEVRAKSKILAVREDSFCKKIKLNVSRSVWESYPVSSTFG